jgi:hypothetical protein
MLDPELRAPSELQPAIDLARRRRQDLDRQQRRLLETPLGDVSRIRHDEQIRLENIVRSQDDVDRSVEDSPSFRG